MKKKINENAPLIIAIIIFLVVVISSVVYVNDYVLDKPKTDILEF